MRPAPTRRDLGLAALALRDRLHYSRLCPEISLSQSADLAREMGLMLDEFFLALGKECGTDPFDPKTEPFYDLACEIATRFEERSSELVALEECDPRADRGCWAYHQTR